MSTAELAIFPLSNVVLFPRVHTPLHLFEPRYRQLATRVLDGSRRIGMTVVPPEHVHEMSGDPPLFPVGCAGTITRAQRLPDGRYNIVLLGTHRFEILEEVPRRDDRLYRIARVRRLDDAYPEGGRERVAKLRGRIVELVADLVRRSDPKRDPIVPEAFEGIDDETFVNSLCHALAFPAPEKQGLLEASDVPARFERLEGLLSFRRAELDRFAGDGSQSVH